MLLTKFLIGFLIAVFCPLDNTYGQNENVGGDHKSEKIQVKQMLPENTVIFDSDTIEVKDVGKVFGVKKLNDSVYYYRNFVGVKQETDIGDTFLKVKSKKGELLKEINVSGKYVLDDGKSLIFVDFETNCIEYVGLADSERKICLDVPLSDANDYIGDRGILYIKLVNNDDYSFSKVLTIEGKSLTKKI